MDFERARQHMVDSQIRPHDVTDLAIQDAFLTTPREAFLPSALKANAYVEREIEYAPGRSLVAPRDHAKLLEAADIRSDHLILDIAVGRGYSTAILSKIAEMVVALEEGDEAVAKAEETLSALGIDNAAIVAGNLVDGAAKQGPFDRIIIASAVEMVPEALLARLKEGGILSTIIVENGVGRGVIFTRSGDVYSRRDIFDASARNITEGFKREKAFAF